MSRVSSAVWAEVGLLLAAAVLALWIYRPWVSLPFSITDFSEFLPLLRRNETFVSRTAALIRYYASEGRFNAVSYVALALKWSVLGANPVAWQLLRAAQMLLIFGGTYALIRRLGMSPAAAAPGGFLLLVSSGGAAAWSRLTMGEPLGILCLLAAQHVALGYQSAERWGRRAVSIGVLVAAGLLAKEMLAASVPFLLILGLCFEGAGRWRVVPGLSRRNVALVASVGVATAAVGAAVLATLAHSRAESFASNYGYTPFTVAGLTLQVEHVALPFRTPASNLLAPLIFPANLLVAALVVAGVLIPVRRRGSQYVPLILGALSLPVLGAAIYLPWPVLLDYHALPFQLGTAILLALGVDALSASGARWAALARLSALAIVGYCSLTATKATRAAAAIRLVNERVVSMLVRMPAGVPVMVAVPSEHLMKPEWQWIGRGPTLTRYATAVMGRRAPVALDVSCEAASELQARGVVTLWYSVECGSPGVAARVYRSTYAYRDWLTLQVRTDSMRVDVVNAP